MRPNSAVFYEGPSLIDGTAIVGVLTGLRLRCRNAKTGQLLQAWILVRDLSPMEAVRSGRDAAICGDCALRGDGAVGRGCYVTYWQGAFRTWMALAKDPRVAPGRLAPQLAGKAVRLGAYGDPAAIPAQVWRSLLSQASGSIGYTQRWRVCGDEYRRFLMASVLSTVAQAEAAALGWRTYRVRGPRDPLLPGEVVCPASAEAGHKLTCEACMLCNGAKGDRRADPAIMVHGKAGNLKALGVPLPQAFRDKLTGRPRIIPLVPA